MNYDKLIAILSGLATFSQEHTELVHGLSAYFLIMTGMVFARILKRDGGEQVYAPVFSDIKLYIMAAISYVIYTVIESVTSIQVYESKGIHGLPIFIGFVGENVVKTLASDKFQVGLLSYISAITQALLDKKMDIKVNTKMDISDNTRHELNESTTPEKEESNETKGGK